MPRRPTILGCYCCKALPTMSNGAKNEKKGKLKKWKRNQKKEKEIKEKERKSTKRKGSQKTESKTSGHLFAKSSCPW